MSEIMGFYLKLKSDLLEKWLSNKLIEIKEKNVQNVKELHNEYAHAKC